MSQPASRPVGWRQGKARIGGENDDDDDDDDKNKKGGENSR